jgi:hypothetical protein
MANDNATATAEKYNFSATTITPEHYQTITAEREELVKKQLAAGTEFMYQHYARLLRMMDVSYERATKANVVLERKTRREQARQKRETLRSAAQKGGKLR